ncbi:hypothetical protein PsorP6_001658 [Peronosclerospora sorghi]|uniref:Uncharacterized protein n=1 Tax=Peronosclerospora sorghi TaxID=230839 RepID=A0ACC0WYR2_9STRA|nr:hypothetical protein PsorP6_001658 [Peronosclerospora sorghi]
MSSTVILESVEIDSTNSMDINGVRENKLPHNSSDSKNTSDPGRNGSSSACDPNSGNAESEPTHSNESGHDDVNQGNYEDTNKDGNYFNRDYESAAGEQGSEASLDGFGTELELPLAPEYVEEAPSSEIGSESVVGEQESEASVDGFDEELELPLAPEYDEAAPEIEIGSATNPTIELSNVRHMGGFHYQTERGSMWNFEARQLTRVGFSELGVEPNTVHHDPVFSITQPNGTIFVLQCVKSSLLAKLRQCLAREKVGQGAIIAVVQIGAQHFSVAPHGEIVQSVVAEADHSTRSQHGVNFTQHAHE